MAFDVSDSRGAAIALLAAGAALAVVPGHHGLPCPLRTLTGVPCPFCGMTTSVEATLHLDLRQALAANPGGIVAVVASLLLLIRPPRNALTVPLVVVVAATAGLWAFELHRFGFL